MTILRDTPAGLRPNGVALWLEITTAHELDASQLVTLLEACRAKDRLDQLDDLLQGDVFTWARIIRNAQDETVLKIDDVLAKANSTANGMKQLLTALRLPDAKTGKVPQYRGPRGALNLSGGSARERLRNAG